MFVKKDSVKKYYYDSVIEGMMKLSKGIINKLTGSVLISYYDAEAHEKQVIDVGLNLKNFTKKVHIPDYVRFVD